MLTVDVNHFAAMCRKKNQAVTYCMHFAATEDDLFFAGFYASKIMFHEKQDCAAI